MVVPARLARSFAPVLKNEGVREAFREADIRLTRLHHSLAARWPGLIRPNPKQLTVAVTSHCNLRCRGCHYGRGFMQGEQLDLATLRDALDDAWEAGVEIVRLYGGEPLLHKDLPAIVRHATDLGLRTYVTTNGTLLKLRF